jgi:hypothetical protein
MSGQWCHLLFHSRPRHAVMSFRYLTDDHFWFTLFHEIGHLILHEAVRVRAEGKEGLSTKRKKPINLL